MTDAGLGWRRDLMANSGRRGFSGAIVAWFLNPGFAVIILHRWSNWGHRRGGRIGQAISRLAWRTIVTRYGCYIDPSAQIGQGIVLPHPVGIVIGVGTRIGEGCTIYQHVTFGRRSAVQTGYPVVGSDVVVYAGATLLGRIEVGDRATIGAHALVMSDVPENGRALGQQAIPQGAPFRES